MKTLKLFDNIIISKKEQDNLANMLIVSVLEGNENPIRQVVKAKSLIEALKKFIEDDRVKDCVLSEISKYGKETSWNEAKIQQKELGVKYDFSNTNDPVYYSLSEQMNQLKAKMKEREEYLKRVPDGETIADKETGEIYEIHPAIRIGSIGYTITFK